MLCLVKVRLISVAWVLLALNVMLNGTFIPPIRNTKGIRKGYLFCQKCYIKGYYIRIYISTTPGTYFGDIYWCDKSYSHRLYKTAIATNSCFQQGQMKEALMMRKLSFLECVTLLTLRKPSGSKIYTRRTNTCKAELVWPCCLDRWKSKSK